MTATNMCSHFIPGGGGGGGGTRAFFLMNLKNNTCD